MGLNPHSKISIAMMKLLSAIDKVFTTVIKIVDWVSYNRIEHTKACTTLHSDAFWSFSFQSAVFLMKFLDFHSHHKVFMKI